MPSLNLNVKVGDELYYVNSNNKIDSEKISKILYQNFIDSEKESITFKLYTTSDKEIDFSEVQSCAYFLSKDELKKYISEQ